jgi:hypothetical protein
MGAVPFASADPEDGSGWWRMAFDSVTADVDDRAVR